MIKTLVQGSEPIMLVLHAGLVLPFFLHFFYIVARKMWRVCSRILVHEATLSIGFGQIVCLLAEILQRTSPALGLLPYELDVFPAFLVDPNAVYLAAVLIGTLLHSFPHLVRHSIVDLPHLLNARRAAGCIK